MTRLLGPLLVVWGLTLSTAAAQQPASTLVSRSILGGGGPETTGAPREQPYILGWSAAVAPPPGLLVTATQSGGLAIDPRSRSVYAATANGDVVCLVDGQERWRTPLGSAIHAAPVLHRELLVVPTAQGVLVTLNAITGELVSRAILGEELITQPRIVETFEKIIALVGSSGESLFAVDVELGQRMWVAHRDAPGGFSIQGFARPAVHEGLVFAGYADGWVQALELETGSLRWERQVSPRADQMDVDALATDGMRVYAASVSGGVYALDLQNGTILWRNAVSSPNQLALEGTMLFVGSPGLVQMLRTFDGKRGWQVRFGENAPIGLRAGEGLVSFAELDGSVFFLDKRSGKPRGLFPTGNDGIGSPPAVVGNLMFVLSNGGRVYSLGLIP